jgi:hypothetical protein
MTFAAVAARPAPRLSTSTGFVRLEDIVIEALKNFPDNIAAFEGDGHLTKVDYETVLIPEIDAVPDR